MTWFTDNQTFYYFDTGEKYRGMPKRIVFDDPILYLDTEGRQLIPAGEWGGEPLTIINKVDIPLDEMKRYLKVEHPEEDEDIEDWTKSAIEVISIKLNRGWATQEEVPNSIRLAVKMTVAHWYENRGDEGKIPPNAWEIVNNYRFSPGT